jgi:hypothetical protein
MPEANHGIGRLQRKRGLLGQSMVQAEHPVGAGIGIE